MDTPPTNTNIEGGCLCKAIRYRIAGVPVSSIICHCNTCRRASAAPSVAWLTFPFASFALVSGGLQTFQSSPGVKRTFCASCGTPLTYESDREPGTIDVTTVSHGNRRMHPSLIARRAPAPLQFWVSDEVKLSEATFGQLSSAFFAEIESKYL